MIDHVTLRVRDLAAAKAFYLAALAPLGYRLGMEFPEGAGLGVAGKLDFWLVQDPEARPQHLAFSSADRAGVEAFHAAALSAGGRDNGPPGLRLEYHPNYFGAFVFDPSGHNVEAVCHLPPAARKSVVKRPKAPARKVTARKARPAARKSMVKGPKGIARRLLRRRMAKGPKG
jgi:catechol 2,3-dioxygenase-like lactoylglutathione lyase family enzyme